MSEPVTFKLASGETITMRAPTPEEATRYEDKRQLALGRGPADALDDGDEELLACVVSPSRAEMDDLLEEFPCLNRQLSAAFRKAGRDAFDVKDAPEVVPEGVKRHVGFMVEGRPVLVRKISRMEMKRLERQSAQDGRLSRARLAEIAASHVVSPDAAGWAALCAELPFLPVNLGVALYGLAYARLEVEEGKSPPASTEGTNQSGKRETSTSQPPAETTAPKGSPGPA